MGVGEGGGGRWGRHGYRHPRLEDVLVAVDVVKDEQPGASWDLHLLERPAPFI